MDPINTVNELELQRFMGDWYVLADVATPFDKDAYEPTEHYVLKPDGMVDTCLLYTSPSPRDKRQSRMPSSA